MCSAVQPLGHLLLCLSTHWTSKHHSVHILTKLDSVPVVALQFAIARELAFPLMQKVHPRGEKGNSRGSWMSTRRL